MIGASRHGIIRRGETRVRVRSGGTAGVEGRVAGEVPGQVPGQVDQIGARVDPIRQVRYRDEAGGVDEGVGALDDHVARGVDVDEGGAAGVGLEEPDHDGDVVGGGVEEDRDGAVGLEEGGGAAVGVGVERGLGGEAGVGLGQGHEVLADQPLGVFGVGEGGWAALGEEVAEELLDVLAGV